MMKKLLFIIVLLLGCMQANAQFEAGKWYVNTSLTGLDLSHSKYEGTNIGFAIDGGTFIADNLSILLDFKGKYVERFRGNIGWCRSEILFRQLRRLLRIGMRI